MEVLNSLLFNTDSPVRGFGLMKTLEGVSGIGEAALRLLVCLLLGYVFGFIWRYVLRPDGITNKHIFSTVCGIWMAIFCYGFDFIQSFLSIVLTYVVLLVVPDRKLGLMISFVGNFGHLLISYYLMATDNYDIDFTTAQSVLTLRLIGISWDYFDGGRNEKELEHDQKQNQLKSLPSLLELLGCCYFFGGFLTGPQYTFRVYKEFVHLEFFKHQNKIRLPSTVPHAMRSLLIGAGYLGFNTVLGGFFPIPRLADPSFIAETTFAYRAFYMWMSCKVGLSKYIGVWMLADGACCMSGINFLGYNAEGKELGWSRLSNVNPWVFETSTTLQGVVESFNINTNDWVKRYIFKRLKFLNNRNISSFGALFFLATWHGLYSGYYFSFAKEHFDMEAEKKLQRLSAPLYAMFQKTPVLYLLNLSAYLIRTFALHYAFVSFDFKVLTPTWEVFKSLYFAGHLGIVAVYIADMVVPKPRTKPALQTVPPKKEN